MAYENPKLKDQGAKWWQSADAASPELTKASMGRFVYEALKLGAQIDTMSPFNAEFDKTPVFVTIFMTDAQKVELEKRTELRFGPISGFASAASDGFDLPV